jgi:hypothetical protein
MLANLSVEPLTIINATVPGVAEGIAESIVGKVNVGVNQDQNHHQKKRKN